MILLTVQGYFPIFMTSNPYILIVINFMLFLYVELNYEEEISSQTGQQQLINSNADLQQPQVASTTTLNTSSSTASLSALQSVSKEKTNLAQNLKSSSSLIASVLSFYLNSNTNNTNSSNSPQQQQQQHTSSNTPSHQIEDLPYIQQKDISISASKFTKSNSNLNSSMGSKNAGSFANYAASNSYLPNTAAANSATSSSSGGSFKTSKTESINCNLTSSNISIASLTSTFSTGGDSPSSPASSTVTANGFNVNNHSILLLTNDPSSSPNGMDLPNHTKSEQHHTHGHHSNGGKHGHNQQHDRSSSNSSNSTSSSSTSSTSTTTTTTHTFLPSNSSSNQTNININMTINTAAIAAATATATATSTGGKRTKFDRKRSFFLLLKTLAYSWVTTFFYKNCPKNVWRPNSLDI